MPTLTGASGMPDSITLTVSGMSSSTSYKRTYKWILNSVVRKTTTDSVAGATSATAYISGLTPNTAYQCKVEIYNPGGSKVSEAGYIRVVTLPEDDTPIVDVAILNYLDGSNTLIDGSFRGDVKNTFLITASGTQYRTYSQMYEFQYFTLSSESYSTKHLADSPIKICENLTVRVYYKSITYPFTTYVYIDGSMVRSAPDTTNTESRVRISDLPGYTIYADTYDFQYAKVGVSSTEYAYYSYVNLTQGSTTLISLYFISKIKSVKPSISRITTTTTTATVYWSKNGGAEGFWYLYYGLSSASMQLAGSITSSPKTITGLEAGKTYIFYVQNYVTTNDKKNSDSVTAATKEAIGYFSWTSNDAEKIKAGQPVKNLTASAWQALINAVAACGGSTSSIPSASSGTKITANHFNQMRNAIAGLSGAGSVVSAVTSNQTKITATFFANTSSALKEAVNRAIATKNNG